MSDSALFRVHSVGFSLPQTHETVAKALVEDPNIFEYDTLYDDMVTQRKKLDPRLQKKDTKVSTYPSF